MDDIVPVKTKDIRLQQLFGSAGGAEGVMSAGLVPVWEQLAYAKAKSVLQIINGGHAKSLACRKCNQRTCVRIFRGIMVDEGDATDSREIGE
jgi:hypothetical protein